MPALPQSAKIRLAGERSSDILRFALAIFSVLLLSTACGSGSDEPSTTPTASASPSDVAAIREIDFKTSTAVLESLSQLGGNVNTLEITFADLTGDQREEAIVPVSSGGTLGNIAYLIFTLESGAPELLLTRTPDRSTASGLVMEIEEGQLVETIGEYGPEDPFCCPSMLRRTYFHWDGFSLEVEREERVPGRAIKQ